MTDGPLTPGEDGEPTSPVIDYSPTTVAYNEAFENELMNAILHPSQAPDSCPRECTPPVINPTTLPVPLSSPLRTHSSPIPGIYLTHANGYHTGGPGPSPSTLSEFASAFIEKEGVQDAGQLERVVEERIRMLMNDARTVCGEREEAWKRNEDVRKELSDLEVQRGVERRVQEKIKEGRRRG